MINKTKKNEVFTSDVTRKKKMWAVEHVQEVADISLSLREVDVYKISENAIWLGHTNQEGEISYRHVPKTGPLVSYFNTELEAQTFLSKCAYKHLVELIDKSLVLRKRIAVWTDRHQKERTRRIELAGESDAAHKNN